MVTILMIPAKMAVLGLLKIKVFRKKGYDVIIYVHDVTNNISSRHSNFILNVVKVCNQSLVTLALLREKLS